MNDRWRILVEQFEGSGYSPHDVQRMVMLYESMKEQDDKLKDTFEQEENEEAPF
jgi:hypothetical protein